MIVDSHMARAAAALLDGPDPDARGLLDALAIAVYTADTEGRITYFNEAAADLWGRRPELGEEWCGSLRLYHLDGSPLAHSECPMAIALREGRAVRDTPAILERPDGERRIFMPYPTPLFRDGVLVGALNALTDITAQREGEESLRRTAAALATSNRVKDEFLGLVSHELRTPVTTVFGNAEILGSRYASLSDAERLAIVADIRIDAARLRGAVENLLTLVGATNIPMSTEPQLLGRIVLRCVEQFRRKHPGCRIGIDAPPEEIIVRADDASLELVLENLLSNAEKYGAAEEGIAIALSVEPEGGFASIAVLDRGIGIEADEAERLFEAFYRSHRAQARTGGLGIGLAVVRRLVEAQGGSIEARERAGGGSEFRVRLPLDVD